MKLFALSLILSVISITAYAQDTAAYRKLPDYKDNSPLCIVNSKIIITLKDLAGDQIKSINIYKGKSVPANLINLGLYGIVDIKTNQQIETKAFRDISSWLNIKGNVKFAVDGFFVDDETLLIATEAIKEINVIPAKESGSETVINIWTLLSTERKGSIIPAFHSTPNAPPGTIWIRGTTTGR